jgi:hypothetical protein
MASRRCRDDSAFHWTLGNYYLPLVHLSPPRVTQNCDFKQDDALPEVNRSFGSRLLAEFVAELFQTVLAEMH